MNTTPHFNPDTACDSCGRFGAFEFDGHQLCHECYELRGSCCPEFGAGDLWPADQPAVTPAEPGDDAPPHRAN